MPVDGPATSAPTAGGTVHDHHPRLAGDHRPIDRAHLRGPRFDHRLGDVRGLSPCPMAVVGRRGRCDRPLLDPLVVVENLPRFQYHVSFVFGLACAAALVVAVTALRPWVEQFAPGRLGVRVIPNALSITATLAVISACMAGSLALYLPGGLDDGTMWVEGLAASYYFLDFGALVGWWGAALAAACALPLSFGEDRVLPRWLGVITVPLVAVPALAAAATGLPGLPGLTMPIWMVAFGAALVRRSA